ncbi:MAG: aldehyde dehydrogenase family protein, partial [Candidatus Niyogibacteria bacterium]|nr:aldehyde dehydrogenase family protein [Candidatus Niyogibacteria bacterium]
MKIIDVDFTNEPQEDFSNPEVRRSIDNALSEYEERRKKNLADNKIIPPIIDGKTYDASHGNIITVFDPADTARALGKVTFADQECIERACSVARDAYFRSMQNFASPSRFDDWIKEKKAVVQEYIQITREERYDIATEMINEVSKSQKGAFAEIEETIDFGEIYLRLVDDVFALYRYQPKLRAESNYCRNKPRGPSLLIKAWNYAFSLPSEAVLASYITGCPPLLKPAPQSSLVGYRVVDIMRRAIKKVGADPGMVAYLPGDRDVGEALVRHPFIANITLTGSLKAGKRINRVAAEVLD